MAKRKSMPPAHEERYDVVIIGAGIAGLTCARTLIDAGLHVLLIEGRNRVGGRILTVRESTSSAPLELGAEFIHGAPKVTFDRLEAAGLTFYDLTDKHVQRKGSQLVPLEFFEEINQLMQSLDLDRKVDRSMDDVLKSRRLEPNVDKLARSYIEGFHAADLKKIGERALALSEAGGADLNGSQSFRITEGYDKLVEHIHQGAPTRLNTIAKKITWKRGNVTIEIVSRAGLKLPAIKSRAVVVTVPLGVLKAPSQAHAAVEISPRPAHLDAALEALHMGHALRLNLRFRTRFWEEGRDEPIGFLHAGPERDFPTWWTQMPLRTPILTAWQGGPRVEKLSRMTEEERVLTALRTLSYLLNVKLEDIQEDLISWHSHDWTSDPFSQGAYSYVGLDGDRKAKVLAEPFGNTLYFSGEATHTAAERGTVDGAIETGLRTAKQILKAFR